MKEQFDDIVAAMMDEKYGTTPVSEMTFEKKKAMFDRLKQDCHDCLTAYAGAIQGGELSKEDMSVEFADSDDIVLVLAALTVYAREVLAIANPSAGVAAHIAHLKKEVDEATEEVREASETLSKTAQGVVEILKEDDPEKRREMTGKLLDQPFEGEVVNTPEDVVPRSTKLVFKSEVKREREREEERASSRGIRSTDKSNEFDRELCVLFKKYGASIRTQEGYEGEIEVYAESDQFENRIDIRWVG